MTKSISWTAMSTLLPLLLVALLVCTETRAGDVELFDLTAADGDCSCREAIANSTSELQQHAENLIEMNTDDVLRPLLSDVARNMTLSVQGVHANATAALLFQLQTALTTTLAEAFTHQEGVMREQLEPLREQMLEELQQQRDAAEQLQAEMREELSRQRDDVLAALRQHENSSAETMAAALSELTGTIAEMLSSVNATADRTAAMLATLADNVTQAQSSCANVERALATIATSTATISDQVSSAVSGIDDLRQQLDALAADHSDEVARIKRDVGGQASLVNATVKRVDVIERRLDSATAVTPAPPDERVDELAAQLTQLREELDALASRKPSSDEDTTRPCASVNCSRLASDLEAMSVELNDIDAGVDEESFQSLKDDVARLKETVAGLDRSNSYFQQRLTNVEFGAISFDVRLNATADELRTGLEEQAAALTMLNNSMRLEYVKADIKLNNYTDVLSERIDSNNAVIAAMRTEIRVARKRAKASKKAIRSIRKHVAVHATNLTAIRARLDGLVHSDLRHQIIKLNTSLQEILDNQVDHVDLFPVKFSARIRFDQTVPISGTVIYEHVLTNVGDAYNASTGYFTAPRKDTYIFDVTLVSTFYERVFASLVVDDREDVIFIYAAGSNYQGSGSNAVIIWMSEGQTARVRVNNYSSGKSTTYIPRLFSTFTGAKL